MATSLIQDQVLELKSCFDSQNFDRAEVLLQELTDKYPNYHTPVILFASLFPVIESDNPLYPRILELARSYENFKHFPENLVPTWYSKIQNKNLRISQLPQAESQSKPIPPQIPQEAALALGETDYLDDILPTPSPYEETVYHDEQHHQMFDPHDLIKEAVGEDADHPDDEILVASETMAEIFAQQKKYDRAIKVYKILMNDEPEDAERYMNRIQELTGFKNA